MRDIIQKANDLAQILEPDISKTVVLSNISGVDLCVFIDPSRDLKHDFTVYDEFERIWTESGYLNFKLSLKTLIKICRNYLQNVDKSALDNPKNILKSTYILERIRMFLEVGERIGYASISDTRDNKYIRDVLWRCVSMQNWNHITRELRIVELSNLLITILDSESIKKLCSIKNIELAMKMAQKVLENYA